MKNASPLTFGFVQYWLISKCRPEFNRVRLTWSKYGTVE
jgi:hypothetical protein